MYKGVCTINNQSLHSVPGGLPSDDKIFVTTTNSQCITFKEVKYRASEKHLKLYYHLKTAMSF